MLTGRACVARIIARNEFSITVVSIVRKLWFFGFVFDWLDCEELDGNAHTDPQLKIE